LQLLLFRPSFQFCSFFFVRVVLRCLQSLQESRHSSSPTHNTEINSKRFWVRLWTSNTRNSLKDWN